MHELKFKKIKKTKSLPENRTQNVGKVFENENLIMQKDNKTFPFDMLIHKFQRY